MVDEPRGQIWGGVVAAPIFRDIARFALQYLEVPPDAPESKRSVDALLAAVGRLRTAARRARPYNRSRGARRADPRARAG